MPFPDQQELLRDMVVNDHAMLEEEPLLVAIYFNSRRVPNEECLLEVLDNFGFNQVSEDGRIFQVQFGRTAHFDLPEGDRLRLFLTNPVELQQAARQGWQEIDDLHQAISQGNYSLLYQRTGNPEVENILRTLYLPVAVA